MHKELWQLHPKIEDADKRHEVVQAAARIRHRSPLFEEEKGNEEPYVPVKPYPVKLCSISNIEQICCLNAEGVLALSGRSGVLGFSTEGKEWGCEKGYL